MMLVTKRASTLTAAIFFAGCASSGSSESSVVPVYATEGEVPCRFEIIERIEVQGSISVPPSPGETERERRRLLGREAASVGADAVLLPQSRAPVGTAVAAVPAGGRTTIPVDFVGDAIRFLPGTCREA
jgi:hypothetical protein